MAMGRQGATAGCDAGDLGRAAEVAEQWRCADSLSLRDFLGLGLRDRVPDHSWLSRSRARLPLQAHEQVFAWVLARLAGRGLVKGERIGVDASTMEANAAMRSIRRRDSGESYRAMLTRMAEASGIATPSAAALKQFDRERKGKRLSNAEWASPVDPITRMQDGRTRLAYKPEHDRSAGEGLGPLGSGVWRRAVVQALLRYRGGTQAVSYRALRTLEGSRPMRCRRHASPRRSRPPIAQPGQACALVPIPPAPEARLAHAQDLGGLRLAQPTLLPATLDLSTSVRRIPPSALQDRIQPDRSRATKSGPIVCYRHTCRGTLDAPRLP